MNNTIKKTFLTKGESLRYVTASIAAQAQKRRRRILQEVGMKN